LKPLIVVAMLVLVTMGGSTPPESKSTLLAEVRSDDPDIRARALNDLIERLESGAADEETIQAFLLAGLETDHGLRMVAHGLVDVMPWQAMSHLIPALSDFRPGIRAQAATGLGNIGPDAVCALDQLLDLLRDADGAVRSNAAVAISRIDSQGASFPRLLAMLEDSEFAVRHQGAKTLDRFGERVRPLVGELLPLLKDDDQTVRYWLVIVVANVKNTEPKVVKALVRLLREDESAFVRRRTARELWEMGVNEVSIPAPAIEALLSALETDPDDGVREQAAKALGSNQLMQSQNRPVLERCVEEESGNLRDVCRDSLKGQYQCERSGR
jgi:hypothetical protein